MADMSPEKHKMPVQEPDVRSTNFNEVAKGYDEETAVAEAKRCLNCKTKPCVGGCPVRIDIPEFIEKVAEGNFDEAYVILSRQTSLPAVCGRVCPQETQCEQVCVRGKKGEAVAIGRLERFVADYHMKNSSKKPVKPAQNGKKVAIIGSGPSGLACAGVLASKGYAVTIFEALHTAGGVLVYGIPEFRLPKAIVQNEINNLKDLGVKVDTNMIIGKTLSIDELMGEYGYEAVFIGSGAGLPRFMNIKGENLNGVYYANEFLTRVNLMKAYKDGSKTPVQHGKKVLVVGGGNVAMDAARCARRLGAEVQIVYRRTENELPARLEEVEHAKEEGIAFKFLTAPVEVVGDEKGCVKALICEKMELSTPDESGRRRPVPIANSNFEIEADEIVVAIGTSPNPLIKATTQGLETAKWGGIIADENGKTSREGVYAAGDAVTGAATVILAMGAGKTAAQAIDEYIKNKSC